MRNFPRTRPKGGGGGGRNSNPSMRSVQGRGCAVSQGVTSGRLDQDKLELMFRIRTEARYL